MATGGWTLADEIEAYGHVGAPAVGFHHDHLRPDSVRSDPEAVRRLADAPFRVAYLIRSTTARADEPHQLAAAAEDLVAAVDLAAAVGAPTVYATTGTTGLLSWEGASDAWVGATETARAHARACGIRLLVENTHAYVNSVSFLHSAASALALAELADIGVCLDVFAIWQERGLAATIRRAVESGRLGLVQFSDAALGSVQFPDRRVCGDGAIPLARLVADLDAAGYVGDYDVELVGPRIDAEGPVAAARRSAAHLAGLLGATNNPAT